MSITTFAESAAELDRLCEARAAVYPVRDAVHQQLTDKLVEFCRWLQTQQSAEWQPDAALVNQAESMQPLFVGGFYKSGTTMVLNLLDGHPQLSALPGDAKLLQGARRGLASPPEQRAQTIREHWIHALVNPTGQTPFWLFGHDAEPYLAFLNYLDYRLAHDCESLQSLMESVACAYFAANPMRPSNPKFWVDKTPLQELDLDALRDLYPGAKFVHVVRNPLAIFAAMKTMADTRENRFRMDHMIDLLRDSLRKGLEYCQSPDYIVLRYEDAVQQPRQTMENAAEQLRIPFHESLLEPTINGMPSTPNSAYDNNREQGKIHAKSLERWRDQLTPREIALIVDQLYDEATTLGYDWSDLRPSSVRRASLRLSHTLTRKFGEPVIHLIGRAQQSFRYRVLKHRDSPTE
jgi:hypothetical protein